MRGRKPIPTAIKQATGAGSHHKKPAGHEPKPATGLGHPHDALSKGAKRVWRSLAGRLERMGVGTNVDRELFMQLCESQANWLELIQTARTQGQIVKVNGQPVANPLLVRADREAEKVRKLCCEFGLSPSSRARLSIDTAAGQEDELAQFMAGPAPTPAPTPTAAK